ncbi:hypothetical protein ACQEVF_57485 [Nonomuraea polychroma]|uniref:hypothetical protein n=1 Tax=Nonomuraea polychroma TaxID=46176 RepID=UPI003D8E544E
MGIGASSAGRPQPAIGAASECHHIFRHWTTPEERQEIVGALDYARSIGDESGILIALVQLLQPCDARSADTAIVRPVDGNSALQYVETPGHSPDVNGGRVPVAAVVDVTEPGDDRVSWRGQVVAHIHRVDDGTSTGCCVVVCVDAGSARGREAGQRYQVDIHQVRVLHES